MKVVDFFNESDKKEILISKTDKEREAELAQYVNFAKRRSNKHTTKILLCVFGALLLCAIILGVLFLFKSQAGSVEEYQLPPEIINAASQSTGFPEAVSSLPMQSEPQNPQEEPTAPPIPKDEWYMALVNAQNPLPEGFDVETKTVAGGYHFDARAIEYLKNMLTAAGEAGIELRVVSASRSFNYQDSLYKAKVAELKRTGKTQEEAEAEASKVTGKAYESEHNLALAADIAAADNLQLRPTFADTPEFAWLTENAHNYGFIMRYPHDKEEITGVQYEPWHWRYVGEEQALLIKESGLCLEEYLNG